MSKYVIEIDDASVDDREDELIGRMVDDGLIQLQSASVGIRVVVVGKVVAEDCPGDQRIMAVEPLEV